MDATRAHRKFVWSLKKLGCEITLPRGMHFRIKCPNGAVISSSMSPSDRNATRQLKRDPFKYGEIEV